MPTLQKTKQRLQGGCKGWCKTQQIDSKMVREMSEKPLEIEQSPQVTLKSKLRTSSKLILCEQGSGLIVITKGETTGCFFYYELKLLICPNNSPVLRCFFDIHQTLQTIQQ